MAHQQDAIDIVPAVPFIRNSYDTGKKEKNFLHPPGLCKELLRNAAHLNSAPEFETMMKAYSVGSAESTYANRQLRALANKPPHPNLLTETSLQTLCDDFALDIADVIAGQFLDEVIPKFLECVRSHSDRMAAMKPCNWGRLLGLAPAFIMRYEIKIKDSLLHHAALQPSPCGLENVGTKWIRCARDEKVPVLYQRYMQEVLSRVREDVAVFNFLPDPQQIKLLRPDLARQKEADRLCREEAARVQKVFHMHTWSLLDAGGGVCRFYSPINGIPLEKQCCDTKGRWWKMQSVGQTTIDDKRHVPKCSPEEKRLFCKAPVKAKSDAELFADSIYEVYRLRDDEASGGPLQINPSTYKPQKTAEQQKAERLQATELCFEQIRRTNAQIDAGEGQPGGVATIHRGHKRTIEELNQIVDELNRNDFLREAAAGGCSSGSAGFGGGGGSGSSGGVGRSGGFGGGGGNPPPPGGPDGH